MKTLSTLNYLMAIMVCIAMLSCVQDNDFSVPESLGDEENKNLTLLLDAIEAGDIQRRNYAYFNGVSQ